MFNNIYKNKSVLITGDTGFKGSWLALWLTLLGANVSGFSLNIPTKPSHFSAIKLRNNINHYKGDIKKLEHLKKVLTKAKPEIVFHLAAQPLVKKAYEDPLDTFQTNTLGSLNLLQSIKNYNQVKSLVMITSDKVYENVEWLWGYREIDRLGGYDPYSASKSMAEIGINSYIKSFFSNCKTKVATARAGNVIGGGDWALDRIVPDSMKAWTKNKNVTIRNPKSTRPWQHVLEPLSGYLLLGKRLYEDTNLHGESFNFGPSTLENFTVKELLSKMSNNLDNFKFKIKKDSSIKEAKLLQLNCDKAINTLKWCPVLNFDETVNFTTDWYKEYYSKPTKIKDFSLMQIKNYHKKAKLKKLSWT